MDEGIKPTEEVKPIKDSLGDKAAMQSDCPGCTECNNCSGCTSLRGGNYELNECKDCGGDQN